MSSLLVVNLALVPPFAGAHENWVMPSGKDLSLSVGASTHHQCVLDTEGILYLCTWRVMEDTEGAYDFSAVTATLDYANEFGKKVIIRVCYKSYAAEDPKPLPAYILNDPDTYGGVAGTGGLRAHNLLGYTPRFDSVNLMARFNALITALAEEVKDHPALQGVGAEESTWSTVSMTGLTAAQIKDAHRSICLHLQGCFPGKEIYPFYNYCDSSTEAEVIAEFRWSLDQGMCAGITDTHRYPDMSSGIQPVEAAYPVTAKTLMCVDYMSTGEDDSGLTERYLENARTAALRGAHITAWYNRGGATGNYWAAAKNAMAVIG